MPNLPAYTGNADPRDYLSCYNRLMTVAHVCDNGKCLCFSITLVGPAEEWWKRLKARSIQSWSRLQSAFRKQFVAAIKLDMQVSALANVKQHPTETLRSYI